MSIQAAMSARREGRYEEALRLLLAVFEQGGDTAFITMFAWPQLSDEYAPAREAMVRTRDAQAALLLAGDMTARFKVVADMNRYLQDSRATYELFVRLLAAQPEQARHAAQLALPCIMEAEDYALAEQYLEDPLAQLEELNERARKLPLFLPRETSPYLAALLNNFVKDVRWLAAVHQGLGRVAEADVLRRAALAGLESREMRRWAERELADPGVLFREISRTEMRRTTEDDWQQLKRIRLAALLDAPTAFGVSHATAAAYTDDAWRDRAAGRGPARYMLAFDGDETVGIVAYVPDANEVVNLIAMWVAPSHRGSPVAAQLVGAVKACATRLVLDVAPANARAVAFYQKQGFTFLPEWAPLESHPHIQVQKMEWTSHA